MSSSWLQNLTNFRLSGVSTRSSNYTNKDKILVVKCTFDKVRMRRITFASVKQVKWSLFKAKVMCILFMVYEVIYLYYLIYD